MNAAAKLLFKMRNIIPVSHDIDDCYDLCTALDNVMGTIETYNPFDGSDIRSRTTGFEKLVKVLVDSVDDYIESKTNYCEMFNDSIEADMKKREYDSQMQNEYLERQNNKMAQMNKNRRIKEESSSSLEKIPLLQAEEGETPSQSGSKGQVIAAEDTKVQLSKIANYMKTEASKGTHGMISQTLLKAAENLEEIEIKETFGETDLSRYEMTIHELVNDKYIPKTSNVVPIGTIVAIGTTGLKLASRICERYREREIQKIKDENDLLNKRRSSAVTLIMDIKRMTENIMMNSINRYVDDRGDNSWWNTMMMRLGECKSYKMIYGIYKIRYNTGRVPIGYKSLIKLTYDKYSKDIEGSILITPDTDILLTKIMHSIMNGYINRKEEIYDKNDIVSYSEYYQITTNSSMLFNILICQKNACKKGEDLSLLSETGLIQIDIGEFLTSREYDMSYIGYNDNNNKPVYKRFNTFREFISVIGVSDGNDIYSEIVNYIYNHLRLH